MNDRLKDPKYINWVKGTQCLLSVKDVLNDFLDVEVKNLHQNLCKTNKVCQNQECHKSWPPVAKLSKNIEVICCDRCMKFISKVIEDHAQHRRIKWNYIQQTKLNDDPWKFAEIYMELMRFEKQTESGHQIYDISKLLHLIENSKTIRSSIKSSNPQKLIQQRNKLFHSGEMNIEEVELENIIKVCLRFLEDPTMKKYSVYEQAVKDISNIKNAKITIEMDRDANLEWFIYSCDRRLLSGNDVEQDEASRCSLAALDVYKKNPDLVTPELYAYIQELQAENQNEIQNVKTLGAKAINELSSDLHNLKLTMEKQSAEIKEMKKLRETQDSKQSENGVKKENLEYQFSEDISLNKTFSEPETKSNQSTSTYHNEEGRTLLPNNYKKVEDGWSFQRDGDYITSHDFNSTPAVTKRENKVSREKLARFSLQCLEKYENITVKIGDNPINTLQELVQRNCVQSDDTLKYNLDAKPLSVRFKFPRPTMSSKREPSRSEEDLQLFCTNKNIRLEIKEDGTIAVNDIRALSKKKCPSVKTAKQNIAEILVNSFHLPVKDTGDVTNFVGKLKEYCDLNRLSQPAYFSKQEETFFTGGIHIKSIEFKLSLDTIGQNHIDKSQRKQELFERVLVGLQTLYNQASNE